MHAPKPTAHLALLAALLAAPLAAQAPIPGPSFREVIELRTPSAPAISPDGRSIVFSVRAPEWEGNRFDTELWMAVPDGPAVQITHTPKGSSGSPAWSPDGRWLAFAADRGDRRQIHLLRTTGGEALQLTSVPEGVGGFAWSPDGRTIAFTAQDPEPPALRKRKELYGDFVVEDAEFRQSHLWVVAVPADFGADPALRPCPTKTEGADSARADSAAAPCPGRPRPRRVTEGDGFTVSGFSWSPDGRALAFAHQRDPLINSWPTADISVVDVATRAVRPLVTTPGSDGGPIWSPDGRWVLYSSSGGDTLTNYFANGQVLKVPAAGGTPVRLAADIDEQVGSLTWTRAGIYALARQGVRRQLYAIDPATGRSRPLVTTPENLLGYDVTPDGRTLALVGHSAATLPEVYRTSADAVRPVALTDFTRQIAGWPVGTAEVVTWKSQDGTPIEGVLHKPRDFDPRRKYPLLVVIHGGPTGIDVPTPVTGYVYPVTQWLAKGALVLRPNYRGSAGYGARFRALNVRNLGVGDAWDVLSGVDHLVAQGVVDTTRMGAMGWSQGGYISAFLTTTTGRFRAISVGAGISDWMTYYVNTDIHPFTRQYLGATPWRDPEIYARTSPITYITGARTPTLIQHGELDRRVPIANAYELFQGLQDHGVPARLVVYKGFGHGIDKPKEQLAAFWHNWEWFGRHLFGEEVEMPVR